MRLVSRALALASVILGMQAVVPFAANAQDKRQNAAIHAEETFGIVEASVFGGITNFGRVAAGLGTSLGKGADVGVRFTVNPNDFLGIELNGSAYGDHKLKFSNQPRPGVNLPELDVHVYQMGINALGYFTPRDRKVRPFLTIGFGPSFYTPNDRATAAARGFDPSFGLSNFSSDTRLTLNYGAGVKWKVHPRIGLRGDVRGLAGANPKFSLPASSTTGGAFIPSDKHIQGVQATIGLSLYFGSLGKKEPVEPPCKAEDRGTPRCPCRAEDRGSTPGCPEEVRPHSLNSGTITASATSICPGETVTLSSNASDPLGHSMSYQWSVDGSNQGSGSSYTYSAGASGDHRIGLRVSDTTSDHPADPVNASAITIHVKNYSRPTVSSVTANPSELEQGQTAALHATASGSECSGTLSYSWTATEGVANGNGADGQYNSSAVSFNEADRSRPQSKRVTITANVTDSKGGSASGSTNVTVNYSAIPRHFGDIVFPKGNSRVNNCAKRILIEQLYPVLAVANSNYDLVLVGHTDANEAPKGKGAKGRSLDKERVLNTAGVLSGGGGTCKDLSSSRIKGVWVGTVQDTEFLPTSCTVSTEAPKERKGNEVDANEAKNRRVELWLVPKGLALPPAARNAADLSDDDLKKVGCPK
jgi:outer membrane protein OmpA-like peptidoglycan-associated protein